MHLARPSIRSRCSAWPTQVYGEMLAAGYGAVGEFHYVHHGPDGTPYDEPNALAIAVAQAAIEVGLEIVLIPAAYHRGGRTRASTALRRRELPRARRRAARVGRRPRRRLGRAWPRTRSARSRPSWLEAIAGYASDHGLAAPRPRAPSSPARCATAAPSTAPARSSCSRARASWARARASCTRIHVDERDVALLADSETIVVTCPTTEGNLGDGHLPALAYRDAGVRLAIGSDSQVRVDPSRRRASSRPARAARAPRAARCWPTTATCGPSWPATAWPASGLARAARRSTSTSSTPTCAASAATSWRSRWRRAPRPASSRVRPAVCAPAAAACRSGRPARAPAGR